MNCSELWAEAMKLLHDKVPPLQYRSYFVENMEPVSLQDDVLVLCSKIEDPMRKFVVDTYGGKTVDCVSEAAGRRCTVRIVTRAELDAENRLAAGPAIDDGDDDEDNSETKLNPKYTFDTFVVGNNNRLAHAASLAVAEAPGESYNPLFIYGGSGLGKTHLMGAIAHYVREQYPEKIVKFVTCEKFMNQLISAIRKNRNAEFRARYRNVDVLLVDDIQFIAGRASTQEEFFHTFNELHEAGKQIVLTSDRPPQEIRNLEERLRTRFSNGLMVDVSKPDVDTRLAILKTKAQAEGIDIPDDVMMLIAERMDTNVRKLEGCINLLSAHVRLINEPVTVEICSRLMPDLLAKPDCVINETTVTHHVCEYFDIDREVLLGPSRRRDVSVPRQIAMYLVRELTTLSLPLIGTYFGGRDHTTVMHACRAIEEAMHKDANIARQVNDLRNRVQGN